MTLVWASPPAFSPREPAHPRPRGTPHVPICLILLLLVAYPLPAADSPLAFSRIYGGAALDTATAIATDREGYVILAGGTASYDFPVTNGSRNAGTQFAVTNDDGRTWTPLGNLPSGVPAAVLADPSAPHTWYAGATNGIFKSTDDGIAWQMTLQGQADCTIAALCGFTSLSASAAQPGTVYALGNSIWKSTDSGATWTAIVLPGDVHPRPIYLAQHPTEPDRLFTAVYSAGLYDLQSFDGGATWSAFSPPVPHPANNCFTGINFDRTDPQRFYASEHCDVFRTTDNGATFELMDVPPGAYSVTPDPVLPNILYAAGNGLWRSTDAGQTWDIALTNGQGSFNSVITDPAHPATAYAGGYVTFDHGATFRLLPLGRNPANIAFDPHTPNRAIAAAAGATSGFLMRLNSAGDIMASSYFGGQGVTNIAAAATDADGNIYLTGTSTSPDFPITPDAYLSLPPALSAARTFAFVTKLSPYLDIVYSTFLTQDNLQPAAIAVDPEGAAVIAGTTYSNGAYCAILKLDPGGSNLLFSQLLGSPRGYSYCTSVAAASNGQTVAAGYTQSPGFPTAGAGASTSLKGAGDAILLRLDRDGTVLDSTLIGGSGADTGVALALDSSSNIYLTGVTASPDFPVTPNAWQGALRSNCAYPSSAVATGMIGTITYYRMDDAFIAKFDPAGNMLFSTYLGADCYDVPTAIAVDAPGHVWIAGETNSSPFPQAVPFESGPVAQQYKGFVSEFDETGGNLLLSSYTGGGERPLLAVDPAGSAWIAGSSSAPPSPYTGPPAPPVPRSGHAYLAKIQTQFPYPISLRTAGNAFSLRSGPVSPGQITLITADGLVPAESIDLGFTPTAPLPHTLAGVQVLFDGEPAPMASVAPGRAVCVAPNSLAGKSSVNLQIAVNGTLSNVLVAEVAADRALLTRDGSGAGPAYARNADGSLNSKDNPAPRNSIVTLYLTGAGIVDASCPLGGTAPATATTSLLNVAAPVAGYLCGFYQMLVTAPSYSGEIAPLFGVAVTYSVQ